MRKILLIGLTVVVIFSCKNINDNSKASVNRQEIEENLTQISNNSVGSIALNFTANNLNNKPILLSDFYQNKKLVLIDFWSSKCVPCRKENPNLVNVYNQFKEKGFDIIGISLDDDKTEWIKAIKSDGIIWTQVSDLKGWNSDIASLYNVTSIPSNFLIDTNGKIVAVNLKGNDLKEKVLEYLQ